MRWVAAGKERIEFDAENSRKLAAAVAQLCGAGGGKKPARRAPPHRGTEERLAQLDRRCVGIAAEFDAISKKVRSGENWMLLVRTLTSVRNDLARIARENGM